MSNRRQYGGTALPQKSVTERLYDFVAGSEAALGAAVKSVANQRATPSVWALPKRFNHLGSSPKRGHSPITNHDLPARRSHAAHPAAKPLPRFTFEARPCGTIAISVTRPNDVEGKLHFFPHTHESMKSGRSLHIKITAINAELAHSPQLMS